VGGVNTPITLECTHYNEETEARNRLATPVEEATLKGTAKGDTGADEDKEKNYQQLRTYSSSKGSQTGGMRRVKRDGKRRRLQEEKEKLDA